MHYTPFILFFVGVLSVPHVAVRTYKWLDKLPIWEERIERRIIKKTAFDYMIKSQAEKERDLIDEYSDY